MAREPALNLPNPWAAVGRDTEAGRALFALYNGYGHARSRGNDYSQINKMKTLKHIATYGAPEFPVPEPPPPKKPEVKVPHFPHKHYNPEDYHPIDFVPKRRQASEILQQIRDESYVVELPPMPKGPLLDDAEKARLQEVFYWSNRTLAPEEPVAEPTKRVPEKGSIEEQEQLLNTIATEIEDREAFLHDMEKYGKGEQYRGQILFEIQQRVGQMKLLHENITKQEKEENSGVRKTKKITPELSSFIAPSQSKSLYARGQGRNPNTTTLRFNPIVASIPELHEDPRFWDRSIPSGRPEETRKAPPRSDKWRCDTPDSATPNVIKTAACCTPDSRPPTTPPSMRLSKDSTPKLKLKLPPSSYAGSLNGSCATRSGYSDPRGQSADPYGQSADPYGQSAYPYGQSADPYGQSAYPYGQSADPYGQSADPYENWKHDGVSPHDFCDEQDHRDYSD